jgi:hypothetical protein
VRFCFLRKAERLTQAKQAYVSLIRRKRETSVGSLSTNASALCLVTTESMDFYSLAQNEVDILNSGGKGFFFWFVCFCFSVRVINFRSIERIEVKRTDCGDMGVPNSSHFAVSTLKLVGSKGH